MPTVREIAVLKHVWTLGDNERKKLNRYYICYCSASEFLDCIETEHSYKDYITHAGFKYEVAYMECSSDSLENDLADSRELEETPLMLLSFRLHDHKAFGICIVRKAVKLAINEPQEVMDIQAIKNRYSHISEGPKLYTQTVA